MEIEGKGIDDVMRSLYPRLLNNEVRLSGTRGEIKECLGVTIRIENPRARISRSENRGKPYSALGELLWYMSGSQDLKFIEPYVPKYKDDAVDGILEGAYGPRLFSARGSINQFNSVENLLKEKPDSKRAVIQIFNAEDIETPHKEIPCTTTMQFFIRAGRLHMSVTMRSNDAYWGLPHDVFCFTMIQEALARRLGCELGEYLHYVGSMHLYTEHEDKVKAYLEEGMQRTIEMPLMPPGDPFEQIEKLLKLEQRLRIGDQMTADVEMQDSYWADILRFLQAFWAREHAEDHPARLRELRAELFTKTYRPYLDQRMKLSSRYVQRTANTIVGQFENEG